MVMFFAIGLDVLASFLLLLFIPGLNFLSGNLFLSSFDIVELMRGLIVNQVSLARIVLFVIPIPIYLTVAGLCIFLRNRLLTMSVVEVALICCSPLLIWIFYFPFVAFDMLRDPFDRWYILPMRTRVAALMWGGDSVVYISFLFFIGGLVGWKLSS